MRINSKTKSKSREDLASEIASSIQESSDLLADRWIVVSEDIPL